MHKDVSKQKLLGVFIDENLTWSSHIDHLCSLISSKIFLLRQLSDYVPVEIRKLFYQGYSLPYKDYGSITWGSAAGIHIERLSKLQKRAARIFLNAEFNVPSAQMFQELGLLSITNRLKYNKALYTYLQRVEKLDYKIHFESVKVDFTFGLIRNPLAK